MQPTGEQGAGMPEPRLAEAQAFEIGRLDRYTGPVAVARVLAARDDRLRVYEVRFAPGARTVWHVHAGDQWLVGLAGTCLVQCADAMARRVGPGEATLIPAGVRHWHGAGQHSGASHLVLNVVGATTWEAPLTVEEYAAAVAHS
jgi:quercetin dioxygenase-like cupin family protein